MKKFMSFRVVSLLSLIGFGIWMQTNAVKKGNEHYEAFNSADIDNRIESVEIAFKGSSMKLNDGRHFVFYPYTDSRLNDQRIFNRTAEKGDRVKKRAFSDTLYLYKGNEVLAYTFKEF